MADNDREKQIESTNNNTDALCASEDTTDAELEEVTTEIADNKQIRCGSHRSWEMDKAIAIPPNVSDGRGKVHATSGLELTREDTKSRALSCFYKNPPQNQVATA